MDLLTYINSYHNCAINNIPRDDIVEWSKLYPFLKIDTRGLSRKANIRFKDGVYASWLSHLYYVGDNFEGTVEAVIDYEELREKEVEEIDVDLIAMI